MNRNGRHGGFTFPELMITMAMSIVIVGALFSGAIGLQKSLSSAERYAVARADQRRLLDYVARDIRRALSVTATNEAGEPLSTTAGQTIQIHAGGSLRLRLPAYYQSNVPTDEKFDAPLPIVSSDGRATYGTATGAAPDVTVIFAKEYRDEQGGPCFVRREGEIDRVIVREARHLQLSVTFAPDGYSCVVTVNAPSPFGRGDSDLMTFDRVMMRNSPSQ